MEIAFTTEETADYLKSFLAKPEADRVRVVTGAYSRYFAEGGLSGETPEGSLVRFYHEKFKPSLELWVAKNDEAAKKIKAVLSEKSPEITAASVAATATFIVRTMDLPNVNERQLVTGLACTLLMIALKAKKVKLD